MKLPIQIIEGMGGLDDDNYKKFCDYCFTSYNTLRKNSSLILNLFQLMIDSSIPILQTPSCKAQLAGGEAGGGVSTSNNNGNGGRGSGGGNNETGNGGGSNGSSNEAEKLAIILKIKEKFMLELNDEEAVYHFQTLINDSISALLPVVIDRLHNLAQYWRA
ncbi:unnamed protein product [Ambrosiozyma monospora]|uniref:Unnamed protein product n=1 Tax=Ambrosiozyma monospora TaxID=43982 RepID=A0ACB5U052_AMBMO|nr:unnamed protein product [Ambrosiozyma monospora]